MSREEFEQYFTPLSLDSIGFQGGSGIERWGNKIYIHTKEAGFPDIDNSVEMAFIGVQEDRASVSNKGCGKSPDEIRHYFYQLMPQSAGLKIVDCGNIRLGKTVRDTYFAVSETVAYLLRRNVLPIIIGGSNDLLIGVYKAYASISRIINIFSLDAKFDLLSTDKPVTDENYVHEIVCGEPNYLFDYTLAGYQTYFVDNDALTLLDDLHFERVRLGLIQGNLEKCEPLIRDADLVSIDVNCLRASDSPCSPSPHGFYGEELCKISNYAGMSDKLTSICFFGDNPLNDINGRTSHIIAHAIYCFIDGYLWRKNDIPYKNSNDYIEFNVLMNNMEDNMVFYKSKKSGRWWVQVPCNNNMKEKYLRHYIVSCSYEDYLAASKGELPDRWLIAYNKLNL